MACDLRLAARLRSLLSGRRGATEKAVFGRKARRTGKEERPGAGRRQAGR